MTIRRQYSLPNCTLVLDGLSDGSSTTGIPDSRPIMSSLFNAECHFVGCDRPLLGGREFLTSLVTAVSNYAQEFLSGIPHPTPPQPTDNLVSLVKGEREHLHHLQAQLEPSSTASATVEQPTKIDLSTVQLFDLLEAIDQFLADKRTLPDIMIPLQPLRKALAQPISTQAVPAGLGLASLVVASLIGYALPAPKVSAPKFVDPAAVTAPAQPKPATSPTVPTPAQPATTTPQPKPATATPQPKPSASTAPAPTSSLPSKTGRINAATQLQGTKSWGQQITEPKLQATLAEKLKATLQKSVPSDRPLHTRNLSYRVAVNKTGEIVDYEPRHRSADKYQAKTPLPKLAKFDPQAAISQAPLAQYKVVFAASGDIIVTPTNPR